MVYLADTHRYTLQMKAKYNIGINIDIVNIVQHQHEPFSTPFKKGRPLFLWYTLCSRNKCIQGYKRRLMVNYRLF